jgi:hypothetical protein
MATPSISNPYRVLAAYALSKSIDFIGEDESIEAEVRATKVCSTDPPLLLKFIELYPSLPKGGDPGQAEGLLRCIWRGELETSHNPSVGCNYQHFKGNIYRVHFKALLLQGPKEEQAIVYGREGETFVRPVREWGDLVLWPDGEYHPRFMRVE